MGILLYCQSDISRRIPEALHRTPSPLAYSIPIWTHLPRHVYTAPDLFVRLATKKPASTDLVDCRDAFTIGRQLFLLGYYEEAFRYLELAFFRHPFNSEYELWHHIAMLKIKRVPPGFYSPPDHQPNLFLYYKTISDIENGNPKVALKRLEKALKKDSHDSLVNHLLVKYFHRPLDEKYFFPVQEGF